MDVVIFHVFPNNEDGIFAKFYSCHCLDLSTEYIEENFRSFDIISDRDFLVALTFVEIQRL